MKNIQLTILFSLLFALSVKAQDKSEIKNPFDEPRYNFFRETVLIFNEYLDTDSGSFNTTNLSLLFPIGNRAWSLRADMPLVSTNTTAENKTGLGDVSVRLTHIIYSKNNRGVALRAKIISNSASDPAFGSGKWVFDPTLYYAQYFNNKKFLWISNIDYQVSFAGDSSRNDVSQLVFENVVNYFFGKNWIAANVSLRKNYINDGYPNSSFIEFGTKLNPNSLLYIHPSIAYGNKKSYNSGIEFGVLIFFDKKANAIK